jgi:hypothetical protein
MGTEAVKGHHKTGYVGGIANENTLAVEGDNGRIMAKDPDKRIIAHPDLKIEDGLILDEHQLVGDHVIYGTSIRDGKAL